MKTPDQAFCEAMLTDGLERFDVLHDAVVEMCNAQDHAGIDRLMLLCLGTGNRGYVRTACVSVKPIRERVTLEIFDRLCDFLRETRPKPIVARGPMLPDDLLGLKATALAHVLCQTDPSMLGMTKVAVETGLREGRATYEKMIAEGKLTPTIQEA